MTANARMMVFVAALFFAAAVARPSFAQQINEDVVIDFTEPEQYRWGGVPEGMRDRCHAAMDLYGTVREELVPGLQRRFRKAQAASNFDVVSKAPFTGYVKLLSVKPSLLSGGLFGNDLQGTVTVLLGISGFGTEIWSTTVQKRGEVKGASAFDCEIGVFTRIVTEQTRLAVREALSELEKQHLQVGGVIAEQRRSHSSTAQNAAPPPSQWAHRCAPQATLDGAAGSITFDVAAFVAAQGSIPAAEAAIKKRLQENPPAPERASLNQISGHIGGC